MGKEVPPRHEGTRGNPTSTFNHIIHQRLTLTLPACLLQGRLLPLFNPKKEYDKVQRVLVESPNGRGTLLYPVYAYELYE